MTRSAPPSGLRDALRGQTAKQPWVDWLFTEVAPRYDLGNDLMSLGWHTRWKKRLVALAAPPPGARVLDLAAGTGDVTWLLAERGCAVVGADNNAEMLAFAEKKRPPGAAGELVVCDALALPFADESFDYVTCAYAGRGFPDWPRVVSEVHRVLKPGGHFWNLDFARPVNKTWDRTVRGFMIASGAVLGVALHGDPKTYVYIPLSLRQYQGQRWLDQVLRDAGFETELVETLGTLMAYNHGTKSE